MVSEVVSVSIGFVAVSAAVVFMGSVFNVVHQLVVSGVSGSTHSAFVFHCGDLMKIFNWEG